MLREGLPDEDVGKLEWKNVSFTIDVISAQQLMRPCNLPYRTVDPYIEVEVFHTNDKLDKRDSTFDIPTTTNTPSKYTTKAIRENGFNPVFDKKCHFQLTTKYPELVFVKFSVKMSPDGEKHNKRVDPMATYTAKLINLKEGYRTLPLLDRNGDRYLLSTLFCRIDHGPVTDVGEP